MDPNTPLTDIEFVNRLDEGMFYPHYETSLQGFMATNPEFACVIMAHVDRYGGLAILHHDGILAAYDVIEGKDG
jgi:hypothetical protein